MAFQPVRRHADRESGKKWFAIFVGIIMLMSVVGFVFSFNPSAQGSNFRYGDLTFRQTQQGSFAIELNGRQFDFFYAPEDVLDIEVPAGVVEKLTGSRVIYITYYWNSTLAQDMALLQYDTGNILEAKYGIFAQPAFTGWNPLNFTVVSCANATSFVPVMLIQAANSTAISADSANPNCIVLNASDSTDLARVADRLKYAILAGDEK